MGPAYSLAVDDGADGRCRGFGGAAVALSLSAIMLCIAVSFSMLSRIAPNAGSSYSWIRMAFGNVRRRVRRVAADPLELLRDDGDRGAGRKLYARTHCAGARATIRSGSRASARSGSLRARCCSTSGLRPTAMVTFIALAFEMLVILGCRRRRVPDAARGDRRACGRSGFRRRRHSAHASRVSSTAMTLGIWMSDGWEVSASTSEEVKGDARAAGRGGIVGLLVTTVVLVFCMTAFMHLGTPKGFADNQADALAYVADLLGGGIWRSLIVCHRDDFDALDVVDDDSCTCRARFSRWGATACCRARSASSTGATNRSGRSSPSRCSTAICELVTGFSPSANEQLNDSCSTRAPSFWGSCSCFSAAASRAAVLSGSRPRRSAGVVIPAIGALALLGVLVRPLSSSPARLQCTLGAGSCWVYRLRSGGGGRPGGRTSGRSPRTNRASASTGRHHTMGTLGAAALWGRLERVCS